MLVIMLEMEIRSRLLWYKTLATILCRDKQFLLRDEDGLGEKIIMDFLDLILVLQKQLLKFKYVNIYIFFCFFIFSFFLNRKCNLKISLLFSY